MESNFERYTQLRKDLKFWIAKRAHAQGRIDRTLKELEKFDEQLKVRQ